MVLPPLMLKVVQFANRCILQAAAAAGLQCGLAAAAGGGTAGWNRHNTGHGERRILLHCSKLWSVWPLTQSSDWARVSSGPAAAQPWTW
jgi:hypothetical protein